ncbi:MAG: hypothetical protein KF862_23065 [Chitinophagaceae bacterium]|nr:hypothetical protein [Chitinophagaceae bacterium]
MADVANIESDPLHSSGISLYSFGLTGLFATSYGQYYFSWDAPHFSLLFTSPLRIKEYIKSKLLFIMIMTFLPATVLVPALLITDSTIIKYYLYFLVYNAGTAPLIVVYIALFNYRKIKIDSKGVFSNYEGVGKSNLLIGVLLCILPVLGLTIALAANAFKWYYAIIFFTGLVNMLLIPLWGRKFAILFLKKKYKFLHHFTESND